MRIRGSCRRFQACVIGVLGLAAPGVAAARTTGVDLGRNARSRTEVAVPDVAHQEIPRAYGVLRRAGLKVSIPRGFTVGTVGMPVALVRGSTPAPGTRVPAGSAVRLRVPCVGCRSLVDKAPPGRLPRYRVPALVGRRLAVAYRWLAHKTLVSQVRFGALHAGSAPRVQANYRVAAQEPPAGGTLSLGIRPRNGPRDSITQTPLRLRATQEPSRLGTDVVSRTG